MRMVVAILLYMVFSNVAMQAQGFVDEAVRTVVPLPGHGDIDVVMLGDSNTSIGGDACNNPRGWNKWFKDKFAPATCRSYARSGATWTNTLKTVYNTKEYTEKLGNDNVVYNQVNRLKEDCDAGRQPEPDLILIAAGTNDAWFKTSRPDAFSETAEQAFARDGGFITGMRAADARTLACSVRYCCEMLMERFPHAQIILLTPMQSVAAGYADIRKAGDIIEGCARRMGLCVIRQDRESCVYDVREKGMWKYTTDGTHTSETGARRNGCYIANRVSVMLQR